ncbi:5'-methylthioadenosine phosphorylase [Sphingomonas zeicaulis]|uniref:S-methyl-5'-thioadenosine phosphorylase n=1 Tax=Sphingomonas zeicaulis TaxID=1632740 RepID=UPI003D1C229A
MGGWTLGVIGGSGLYAIDALEDQQWIEVETPWGKPSDALLKGRIGDVTLIFLPRHGRGHRLSPSEINYRANIDALKRAGCTDILSVSAVGSLREHLAPGMFAAPDQLIDRTWLRQPSFFGSGMVAHVSMADPVCPRLAGLAVEAARSAGAVVAEGGTHITIEGPQFSTRAESHLYRSWNCDLIGMTAMPEAKLAREAELPYALVGMVTDYDCWREGEDHVDVASVMKVMAGNAKAARAMVREIALALPAEREVSPIDTSLDFALITAPDARDPALLAKLDAVAGRVLKS